MTRIARVEHKHIGHDMLPCRKCGLMKDQHRTREGRKQVRADGGNGARARSTELTTFVGVDGEGVTREDGTHDYVLLTVGRENLVHRGPGRLTWQEIFPFLYQCYEQDPYAAFVGYYLGYDFTQWLRTIPESRAESLWTPRGKARRTRKTSGKNPVPFPVYIGTDEEPYQWEFDVLGMKKFKLRPGIGVAPGLKSKNPHPWMHVCDTGAFFQQSFLKTLEGIAKGIEVREDDVQTRTYLRERGIEVVGNRAEIMTPEEFRIIKEGKERRASAKLDDEMIRYNLLECDLLGRVMPLLNCGFKSQVISLKRDRWFGPGQAAQAWLANISAPTAEAFTHRPRGKGPCRYKIADKFECKRERSMHVPEWGREIGRLTYFGGWFEIFAHGLIPGPSYEYDVNSAYPDQISRLPCLLHGAWSRGKASTWREATQMADRTLVAVRGRCEGHDPRVGSMLHRTHLGSVLRPQVTEGWYWLHELLAAERAGVLGAVAPTEWVSYEGCDHAPPFSAMRDLYLERIKVGKETPRGKSYKLLYNSGYGKMAQSIGSPRFANGIYASLITAGCRVKILDAIATHPTGTRDLLMVATDGVYFRTKHPGLDFDKEKLGAWSQATKRNLLLFMPGLYWDDEAREALESGGSVKLKSRGVPGRDMAKKLLTADALFDQFDGAEWPKVKLSIDFSMVTVGQALDRHKWGTCGEVRSNVKRVISADPVQKRAPGAWYRRGVWQCAPYALAPRGSASEPYDRKFGDELAAMRNGDIDDETPDGLAHNLMLEALGR